MRKNGMELLKKARVKAQAMAVALSTGALGTLALAQSGTGNNSGDVAASAFSNLQGAICAIANQLGGPLGFAVVVLMMAIGAIGIMTGSKWGTGMIIGAGLGGVVVVSAKPLAKLFMGSDKGGC